MPIYEYRCSACGHELEALQKLSDAPLVACPACAKDTLVKLISAAGFQLKGSGWYATDFKSSGTKPAAKGEGAAAKPSESKPEGKAGDKPADGAAASTAANPPATGAGSSTS
jgi:putative FmdB family regulatory protein